MAYGLRWSFDIVEIGAGCGPMSVSAQQVLTVNQYTNYVGAAPGGVIAITSTGAFPTTGNMSTALSAAATAAGLVLNAQPALAQWQGFATGGG